MATYNITEVRLLSVPLENDYKHTFYFNTLAEQTEYFLSKTKWYGSNFSYQRKDGYIAYPRHFDSLRGCNYVMYKNTAYGDKWFYAFIKNMKYVNDDRTDIYIETDVIQTWLKDYIVKPSFIEREHVDSDIVGEHTVPEQLETGDYVILAKNKNASLLVHNLIMAVTVNLNEDGFPAAGGAYYNGIYSGVKYYLVNGNQANEIIEALATAGKSDAIVSIFVCPTLFVSYTTPEGGKYAEVDYNLSVAKKDWINTLGVDDEENYKVKALNGYIPRNKKLLTYPYTYMLLSNNSGGSAIYKYELFNNPDDPDLCTFYIYGSVTPGMSIYISPRYYNGVDINSLEGLTLGKYPICSWNTDVYTNWLTQNAVNIPLSIGSAVVGTAVGVLGAVAAPATGGLSALATMGAVGAGIGGVQSVLSTVGEIYQHSLIPPQAEGNINSGDVMFSAGCLTFTAYQMSIKAEFAKVIDDYFTMFGYKVNRVKLPSVMHRENYWYTKTIDVNIDGAIPTDDLNKIKDCYNRGITFWYRPEYIGNYSVTNEVCG